jgi:hypothetical protein
MNLKRQKNLTTEPPKGRALIRAADLLKQVELLAGIRQRIHEGYYDQPEVLASIAEKIEHRLKY